ncbi:MAG: hypothetical protein JRI36_10665 [Deltaproteobacteria bacterium]|nr:hypothetical protein [Deltaproteobacteria bacterium]
MRKMWFSLLIMVAAGCIPYSEQPLSPPGNAVFDSQLCGTWFFRDDNERLYLHVGRDGKSRQLRIVMLDYGQNDDLEISEFSGHTSRIGQKRYLNLRWVKPAEEESGYMFVHYVITGGRLGISLMDLDTVEKAIQQGALKGAVKKRPQGLSVRIKEDPEKLRRYFLQHHKELFQAPQYLKRLVLPELAASGEKGVPSASAASHPEYQETSSRPLKQQLPFLAKLPVDCLAWFSIDKAAQ